MSRKIKFKGKLASGREWRFLPWENGTEQEEAVQNGYLEYPVIVWNSGERFHIDNTTEEEIEELDNLDCNLVPAWAERWGYHNGEAGALLRRLQRGFLQYLADETGNPKAVGFPDSENYDRLKRLFMIFMSSLYDSTPMGEFIDDDD